MVTFVYICILPNHYVIMIMVPVCTLPCDYVAFQYALSIIINYSLYYPYLILVVAWVRAFTL